MSRYLAAFYHLLISLVIFVVIAYLILFVWYPGIFYTTDGGWEGMRIIIAVDLVLGPLLTLVIFKAGKPGLKFDLACIGTLQAACLAAGLYIVHTERPLAMIYYDKYMYSASADTFARYNQPVPDLNSQSPVMLSVNLPDDPIARADILNALYSQRLPVWILAENYGPMENHIDEILENSYDVDTLRDIDEEGHLEAFIASEGGTIDDYAFFPLHSRYRSNNFVVVRRADNEFVDVLPIKAPLYQ